jgi:DNA-binding FadR family transcriptional regulator
MDRRFQEIPRERVADRIAGELLRMISSGELAPGERLPGERQLADMMGVSRVSVRAALQQLKAQGFVTAVQGGGTRITAAADQLDSALARLVRANRNNLHDLAEVRSNLEVWAARRAAERGSPEQIAEIERIIATQPGVLGFHDLKTRRSGSRVFVQVHLELDGAQTLRAAHDIGAAVRHALLAALPEADVIIHKDPVAVGAPAA